MSAKSEISALSLLKSPKTELKGFGDHVNQFYDQFTTDKATSFKSLGKYHCEVGKMPKKVWGSTIPVVAFDFKAFVQQRPTTEILEIAGEELYKSPIEEERERFLNGFILALDRYGKLF